MKIILSLEKSEYEMLKAYAAAKRKYEVGVGYSVDKAINEMVTFGLQAISETTIMDSEGNLVEWNHIDVKNDMNNERQIFRKY